MSLRTHKAARAIRAASESPRVGDYSRYWAGISPADDRDYFNRWVFAFASVQTGWRHNVMIYERLTAPGVSFEEESLRRLLSDIGAGMVTVRSKGLSRLHRDYWADPSRFRPQRGEGFVACRDRLVRMVHGLGVAKVAFVLELSYPLDCDAVCLDRHLLRLYGCDGNAGVGEAAYREAEAHWGRTCRKLGVPCAMARHIYWDGIQRQDDTRYWSHVFERGGALALSA